MTIIKNYLSKLKTNSFVSEDKESKNSFFNYCINTNTASYFLDRPCTDFRSAMDNQDFRKSLLFAQKKSLQHQSSLKSFLKLAEINDIDICLLKGAFMSNFVYHNFTMRVMRDIDVLVEEDSFLRIVNIMLKNGYVFVNSGKKELSKFDTNYAHQAPVLLDKFGIAFEIHHRLKTQPEVKNSDYLTKNLLKYKKKNSLFGIPVSTPNDNFAFIHCCYHAIRKSKLSIGPTFLNDLMQLKDRIDKDILEDARKSNCEKEVEFGIQISKYLQGMEVVNATKVENAIEIIIHCYKMPEFFPRKKLNLLSSLNKSYAYNSYTLSVADLSVYIKLKLRQALIFFKLFFLNYSLYKKRSMFFRDFNS